MCSPGYFKDSTTNECKACPKGTFSDEVDATSCTSCPEGQTTSGDGNTECREGKEKNVHMSFIGNYHKMRLDSLQNLCCSTHCRVSF